MRWSSIEEIPGRRIVLDQKRWGRAAALAIVGTLAIGLPGEGWVHQLPGKSEGIVSIESDSNTVVPQPDKHLVVLDWNMHDELASHYGELQKLVAKRQVDAVMLQEVNGRATLGLKQHVSGLNSVYFFEADSNMHRDEGGYGNVIATVQRAQDPTQVEMSGTATLKANIDMITGLFEDLINGDVSFHRFADATQENRTVGGVTIPVLTSSGSEAAVRLITTHIGQSKDPALHNLQYEQVKTYTVQSENDNQATVLGADYNTDQKTVFLDYLPLGYQVPITGPTLTKGSGTIDSFAMKPSSVLGPATVRVLRNHYTDHYPVLFSADAQ